MKKSIKLLLALTLAIAMCFTFVGCTSYKETKAEAFNFVHGGYAGHAVVTLNADGSIKTAELHEYVITDWAAKTEGAVIRVKDSTANADAADANVKGFRFFIYDSTIPNRHGSGNWAEYKYAPTGFTNSKIVYSDVYDKAKVPGIMIRDYVAGMNAGENRIVTVAGAVVTLGQDSRDAVKTTSVKTLDKTDKESGYMALNAGSIGYRYNALATVNFFKANVNADVSAATLFAKKVILTADKNISNEDISKYTAATDKVWKVGDVETGATWTDFPQYVLLLQDAYVRAVAAQRA